MTTTKQVPATESQQSGQVKAPYRAPQLEILGSLRSATRGTGGGGGDANMMMVPSDRRAKEDIVKVGQHPLGLGIYRFRYRAPFTERYGAARRIGVMADEVAEKYPDAVSRNSDGYLRVDYARLFH